MPRIYVKIHAVSRQSILSLPGEPASCMFAVVEARVSRRPADRSLDRARAALGRLGLSGVSTLAVSCHSRCQPHQPVVSSPPAASRVPAVSYDEHPDASGPVRCGLSAPMSTCPTELEDKRRTADNAFMDMRLGA